MFGKTIEWLRQEYKSILEDGYGEMSVIRGKIHKYLGNNLAYTVSGTSRISMLDYIDEILTTFEKMYPCNSITKSSAAPDNLFNVDEDCEKLSPDKAKVFHNLVFKKLYTTNRARPDTWTPVVLLTSKLKEPDIDDWKKLAHLMNNIRKTRNLPLILGTGGAGILKLWIDTSFTVHTNMRGHTSGRISRRRSFPVVSSTNHKLYKKRSTEADIVGLYECMPSVCWTRYFPESQD